jgi:DNA (cytosine-5)-methyltransferase 1
MMDQKRNMIGVSLFSNIGIGEAGLPNHINIVLANELLKDRADFYKKLHPNTNMIQGDITDETIFKQLIDQSKQFDQIDFLIATPPCQGMSVAGKMDKNDPRNSLIIKVLEYIIEIQPTYILIENVEGMKRTKIDNKLIPDLINENLSVLGYHINSQVLDTADFGIPQHRRRMFFLISKKQKWSFPEKVKEIQTVKNAIGHLCALESGQDSGIPWHFAKKHNDNHILWMKHTPSGQTAFNNDVYYPQKINGDKISGFSTTYKRIDPNKPAPTITMSNGAISSQNNVHYGEKQADGTYNNSRVLTLRELFILMTIPENIIDKIPMDTSDNFLRKVIGEGIPSKMITKLTENLMI